MKSMLYGVAILLFAASATAQTFPEEDAVSSASTVYSVDEDRDGRTDGELVLEQSDSLA